MVRRIVTSLLTTALLACSGFTSVATVAVASVPPRAVAVDRGSGGLVQRPHAEGDKWQGGFNSLATRIALEYSSEFATAEVDEDGVGGWIGFRADVPAGALPLIASVPRVRVETGLGYTTSDSNAYGRELLDAARDASPEADSVAVFRELNSLEFKVLVGPAGEGGFERGVPGHSMQNDSVELVQAAVDAVPNPIFSASAAASEMPVAESEDFDGGRRMASVCTGSFPVKRNGGPELGLLTAGHCPGMGGYHHTADAFYPVYPMSLATTDVDPGGDFRWNHSKTMVTGFTYVGGGTLFRKFSTAADPQLLSTVCSFGVTSGYKCSQVTRMSLYYSVPVPDVGGAFYAVGPLRGTSYHITQGGDSGGPWFNNYIAYGIHSGVVGNGSAFSSVPSALRRLGVSLWTG